MKREYTKAQLGSTRTTTNKKPLDHLTQDVLAAQAAGMSYGNWKAMHPHTGGREESEPEELTVDPDKRVLVCVKCGKTFLASSRSANQKYCSDACRYQQQTDRARELHPERYKPRKCQHCGKTLEQSNPGKYCNRECRRREWLKKDRQKNPEKYQPRPCPVCGMLWVPDNGRIYCSEECRQIGTRERARENDRRRREREKEAKANVST